MKYESAPEYLPLKDGKYPTRLTIEDYGTFYRGAETPDFIYYVNYQEGDDNGNTILYRKEDLSLASDNYFASNALFEDIEENEITFLSRPMKYNVRELKKQLAASNLNWKVDRLLLIIKKINSHRYVHEDGRKLKKELLEDI